MFFLQRGHQAKKLGEDRVGERHLIWMQVSLNQMNSCNTVVAAQNHADYFFRRKFGGTPHQESEDMIREMEGTRNVQEHNMAKTKTHQMRRS